MFLFQATCPDVASIATSVAVSFSNAGNLDLPVFSFSVEAILLCTKNNRSLAIVMVGLRMAPVVGV